MSLQGIVYGGLESPDPTRLTSTSLTDIVTGEDRTAVIARVHVSNETGSAAQLDCYYYDGTTDFLEWSISVAANSTEYLDTWIRLNDGAKFKAQAGTANALTVSPRIVRINPNEAVR